MKYKIKSVVTTTTNEIYETIMEAENKETAIRNFTCTCDASNFDESCIEDNKIHAEEVENEMIIDVVMIDDGSKPEADTFADSDEFLKFKSDMLQNLKQVQNVLLKQQAVRKEDDVFQLRLSRLVEEVGEASRAYRDWVNDKRIVTSLCGVGVAGSQSLHQNLVEETIDCIISSMALFIIANRNVPGKCNIYPDINKFNEIFTNKLNKWEANIDKGCD